MDWQFLATSTAKIEKLGIFVIVSYLVIILGVGIWAGLKRRGGTESKGYFLAGGTLTWPLIGMVSFSTNISSIVIIVHTSNLYLWYTMFLGHFIKKVAKLYNYVRCCKIVVYISLAQRRTK